VAPSEVAFLDMAAHQADLAQKVAAELQPSLTALGVALHSFVIENLSLPDELQKVLDRRIGMNLAGDLGRYTQFEAAQSLETAAANTGGAAGVGVGLGAGVAMAQTLMSAVQPAAPGGFCQDCGHEIPRAAKFCPNAASPRPLEVARRYELSELRAPMRLRMAGIVWLATTARASISREEPGWRPRSGRPFRAFLSRLCRSAGARPSRGTPDSLCTAAAAV